MNRSGEETTDLFTNVSIRFVQNGADGLIGWASCIVSHAIKVDNVAIRRAKDGSLFLTFPNKVGAGGTRHPYFHPISVEAAKAVENAVLARLASLAKAAAAGGTHG